MLAQDILLMNEGHNMRQLEKLGQSIAKEPPRISVLSESEDEQRRLLDLRIGLALLGEEGRKQLLQYMRVLRKRDEEKTSKRGRIPSA
jgi:hypothetical protein